MKNRASSNGFVLLVGVFYLLVLFVTALFYFAGKFPMPNLGSLPIGVPWFGALGAVTISLSGVVDHRNDWERNLAFWHFIRPLMGIILAIISVLIFQAGILAVASNPTALPPKSTPSNLLYYLIAFVVGYREAIFRDLIKRVADIILTPGGSPPTPVIGNVNPSKGSPTGGESVTIMGSGFTGATVVKFGSTLATSFQVDSDSQITVTTPPGATGSVNISVTTKSGSITGGKFTYE